MNQQPFSPWDSKLGRFVRMSAFALGALLMIAALVLGATCASVMVNTGLDRATGMFVLVIMIALGASAVALVRFSRP